MRISISENYTIPTNLCVTAIKNGLFIECDTTANEITITLPSTGAYDNSITVIDKTGNAGTNNIIIASAEEETIQGNETITISTNNEIVKLKPVSDGLWDSDQGGSSESEDIITVTTITPTQTTYSDGRPLVESGISSMGSSPITLLDTPEPLSYYKVKHYDLLFEGFMFNNLDFNHFLRIDQAGKSSVGINRTMIIDVSGLNLEGKKFLRVFPGTGLLDTVSQSLYLEPIDLMTDGKITLKMAKATSPFNANPSGGDGILTVTTVYNIETITL